jgi:hypothetical protein
MSIYILLEYIEICSHENIEPSQEGLHKLKKLWN